MILQANMTDSKYQNDQKYIGAPIHFFIFNKVRCRPLAVRNEATLVSHLSVEIVKSSDGPVHTATQEERCCFFIFPHLKKGNATVGENSVQCHCRVDKRSEKKKLQFCSELKARSQH